MRGVFVDVAKLESTTQCDARRTLLRAVEERERERERGRERGAPAILTRIELAYVFSRNISFCWVSVGAKEGIGGLAK